MPPFDKMKTVLNFLFFYVDLSCITTISVPCVTHFYAKTYFSRILTTIYKEKMVQNIIHQRWLNNTQKQSLL